MRLLLTVFLVFFWMGPVQADYMYEYEFEDRIGSDFSYEFSWSFTSVELLTESTTVGVDDLLSWSSTNPESILYVLIIDPATVIPAVQTGFGGPGQPTYVVPYDEPFDAPGSYEVSNDRLYSKLDITETPMAPVPEPATMLLFGTGLAGLAGYRKRRGMKK